MKKLLCLGLLFLSIQAAQAQTAATPAARPVASKDDDTMVLTLTDTPEASWRRLAQILVQRGYSIQHSDKDLLTLSTYALYKPGVRVNRVAGTVINGALIVRMYWGAASDTGGGQPLLARRKHDGWGELVAIGREFGGAVSYTATTIDY
ncbi:hypothetical protein SAMN00120144_1973 [Hymenobacter roseosalivarius DSM 11622]|uniref:Uncharacterized protein n=1 Tax=Hymenobacter roseosalivarius DSM 11622 TaxID=645990 RepID=A0A1W1W417_9BACT|nr:hypothetical protein [Hymenobacter roseosalivarius]SMC00359.1 hypothetical protein SAMN00120144_1973 [Hymenobacter roseosalivarius DSM 11622]